MQSDTNYYSMSYVVVVFLTLFQISQADSVIISNKVQISADQPKTSHVEPHLSVNPSNPGWSDCQKAAFMLFGFKQLMVFYSSLAAG